MDVDWKDDRLRTERGEQAIGRRIAGKVAHRRVGGEHTREFKCVPDLSRNGASSGFAQAVLQAQRRGRASRLAVVVVVVDRRGARPLHVRESGEDARQGDLAAAERMARRQSPKGTAKRAQAPPVLPRGGAQGW